MIISAGSRSTSCYPAYSWNVARSFSNPYIPDWESQFTIKSQWSMFVSPPTACAVYDICKSYCSTVTHISYLNILPPFLTRKECFDYCAEKSNVENIFGNNMSVSDDS